MAGMTVEPPVPQHHRRHMRRVIGRLAHLQEVAARQFLGDAAAQHRHQVGLDKNRRRRETRRPQRDPAREPALVEPAVDEARILEARGDFQMGQNREIRRRQLTAARRMPLPHHQDECVIEQWHRGETLAGATHAGETEVEVAAVETRDDIQCSAWP
jgi:hypothetical protein